MTRQEILTSLEELSSYALKTLKAQKYYFSLKTGNPQKAAALDACRNEFEPTLKKMAEKGFYSSNALNAKATDPYDPARDTLYNLAAHCLKTLDWQQKFFTAQYGSKERDEAFRICREDLEPELRRMATANLRYIKSLNAPLTLF